MMNLINDYYRKEFNHKLKTDPAAIAINRVQSYNLDNMENLIKLEQKNQNSVPAPTTKNNYNQTVCINTLKFSSFIEFINNFSKTITYDQCMVKDENEYINKLK